MLFSSIVKKLNNVLADIAGGLILAIALLTAFESIARSIFSKPTSWSMDLSGYLLIWLIFIGGAYTYQAKGHVAVDFLRDIIEKKYGKKPRKAMALIGWGMALAVIIVLLRAGYVLVVTAISRDQLTSTVTQIPIVWLYLAILVGSIIMTLTVLNIIIEVVRGNEDFL